MTDSVPTTAAGWTRNAVQEINGGEISDARQMLATAIRLDPDYDLAWIWFGSIATDDAERRYCYERAIGIDPNSVVASSLGAMRTTESRPPVELQDLEAPPLPEEFGGEYLPEPEQKRRWLPLAIMAGLLLAVLLGSLWYVWQQSATNRDSIPIAFVANLESSSAAEMQRGLALSVDYINQNGGVDGRHIEIIAFDDQDDVDQAMNVAHRIVADGRFVAVVGHRLSATSLAAAPIYEVAGLPMISPTSTVDELTASCKTCYRTIFDNSTQGQLIASYVLGVLDIDRTVVIAERSDYGDSLVAGFESVYTNAGGMIDDRYVLDADPVVAGDTIRQTAEMIANKEPGKLVLLAAGEKLAEPLLVELRAAGVNGTIFGGDAVSSQQFLAATNQASRDAGGRGDVTTGLLASSPVFADSLTGDAVRLAAKYQDDFGELPTWRTFTTADAGVAIAYGLRSAGGGGKSHTVEEWRSAILAQWATLDSPERSVPGFVGPLYFDANRTAAGPVAIGIASGDFFDSAPRQLVPFSATSRDETQRIQIGDSVFAVQRVVHSGVDFNLIRDLNTVDETFYADFFVWFKYFGDDDATDVIFTNMADPEMLTLNEVRSEEVDGMKYKVYRITGTFTSRLDFHAFPFDTQNLRVTLQNRILTSTQLVYSIDSDFAEIPQNERLSTGGNARISVNQINNWKTNALQAFAATVGTSSNLGDPSIQTAGRGIEFSQLGVNIGIHRQVGQFLLKNLLPLILLLAITYISLFFSHEQTTERVSFGITGVLTGAVLLSTVVSVLPDVGYTVAIEWAFYGFILLSALCILVALIGGRLNEAKQISEMRILDRAAQVGYPVIVALVVVAYWVIYR